MPKNRKWKIQKLSNDFFSPDHREWVAWTDKNWTQCRAFATHAEALAYVNYLDAKDVGASGFLDSCVSFHKGNSSVL